MKSTHKKRKKLHKMQQNTKVVWVVMISILVGSLIFLGSGIVYYYKDNDYGLSLNENGYQHCGNKTVEDHVKCVIKYISSFYDYKPTKDSERTLSDIIENGGDCYDYSRLYVEIAKELGYNAKKVSIFGEESEVGHAFALIWDEEVREYCIVEGLNMECWGIG